MTRYKWALGQQDATALLPLVEPLTKTPQLALQQEDTANIRHPLLAGRLPPLGQWHGLPAVTERNPRRDQLCWL